MVEVYSKSSSPPYAKKSSIQTVDYGLRTRETRFIPTHIHMLQSVSLRVSLHSSLGMLTFSYLLPRCPAHSLNWYRFIGRILGKALYEGILAEVAFAGFFLAKVRHWIDIVTSRA